MAAKLIRGTAFMVDDEAVEFVDIDQPLGDSGHRLRGQVLVLGDLDLHFTSDAACGQWLYQRYLNWQQHQRAKGEQLTIDCDGGTFPEKARP